MVKIPNCLWHHIASWKCRCSSPHLMLLCTGSGVGIGLTAVNEQCRCGSGYHGHIDYSGKLMTKQAVIIQFPKLPTGQGPVGS